MNEKSPDNKDLEQIRQSSHESRDKALLTLCSAGLAFSLAFYEKLYSGHVIWLLILTWGFFAVSMLAVIWSFVTAEKAVDRLEDYLHNKEKYKNNKKFTNSIRELNRWTKLLNITSIGSFTFATIIFIIFCTINIWPR